MSSWPARRRTRVRARALSVVSVLVVASAVLAACSSGSPSVSSTDLTAPTTTPGLFNRFPPVTVPPGCPTLYGSTATLTVDDGGLIPRCATVTTNQKLRIKNVGKSFHNVQIEDLNANLSPNDTQYFDKLGKYLGPGNYLIWSWTESDPSVFPNFNGTLVLKSS
jgi:hypothetical protein